MNKYLKFSQTKISDFSDENIESLYNQGFVFTRIDKGVMDQTRSLKISLTDFNLSSENRRILRKTEKLALSVFPVPYQNYEWTIHKLGKDFYEKKFGSNVFSANKIKESIQNAEKSNFNRLFVYSINTKPIGYCICLETKNIVHYSYPFYSLETENKNIGMGMMLKAIEWAKKMNKKNIYLGSAQRPSDTYKLQFAGLEWFDGKTWQKEKTKLKEILSN